MASSAGRKQTLRHLWSGAQTTCETSARYPVGTLSTGVLVFQTWEFFKCMLLFVQHIFLVRQMCKATVAIKIVICM